MTLLFYRRGLAIETDRAGGFPPYVKQWVIRLDGSKVTLDEADAAVLQRRLARSLKPKK